MEINAHKILSTHRISVKTNRRKNGTVDQYYSIQFTYQNYLPTVLNRQVLFRPIRAG